MGVQTIGRKIRFKWRSLTSEIIQGRVVKHKASDILIGIFPYHIVHESLGFIKSKIAVKSFFDRSNAEVMGIKL